MILGIGTDIVNMDRIEESINKFGDSFIKRCFTPKEIELAESKPDKIAFYAKRFAGKEAFSKAIGTGITGGVSWQDMEIHNNIIGKPMISVKGKSLEKMNKLSQQIFEQSGDDIEIHLSISDDKPYAMATVIIEKR